VGYHENYYETKLYVDTGKGLNEDESIVYKIDTGKNQLHFDLTPFNEICELRFDPIDCAACLKINRIAFSTLNGQEYEYDPEQVKSNARFHQNSLLMFDSDDPQMFFMLSQENMRGIKQLSISLTIHHTKADALREIIFFQNSQSPETKMRGLRTILNLFGSICESHTFLKAEMKNEHPIVQDH
jgi:hypothetical protein